jgi:hypothetical protein
MIVAIVGSRSFKDFDLLTITLNKLKIHEIISGGAVGADFLAEQYAQQHNIKTRIIKPEYKKYSRVAPIIRNKSIVDNSDLIIAFWNGISRGTKNVIEYAKKTNKKIEIIYFNEIESISK